jgi:amylosucrase
MGPMPRQPKLQPSPAATAAMVEPTSPPPTPPEPKAKAKPKTKPKTTPKTKPKTTPKTSEANEPASSTSTGTTETDSTETSSTTATEPQDHLNRLLRRVAATQSFVDASERGLFTARLRRYLPDVVSGLAEVYPYALNKTLDDLISVMLEHHEGRDAALKALDTERMLNPDWFLQPDMVGYVLYTERFAGNLAGVRHNLDYLSKLGVTYLHLMPLLKPRPAPHDGGYAVEDYRQVRPDLGDMNDLRELAQDLRQRGMSLCLDLVLNHVAAEHEWAVRARRGEAHYQQYFYMYPDQTIPNQFEQSLPEIFPDFAPGNFTYDEEAQHWVWTTFNSWQWDLNWANPEVFVEFAKLILWLANQGVSIFRLDAIAFIWKRLGTNCQNLPEVHAITQALRAVARIVAPSVIFKAEAIVAPQDLIHYLGRGKHHGKVSDLAYHNSLMVQLWSSLASRDTRLLSQALADFPREPASTTWGTYLRCHDDIGWAISDTDAAKVGLSGEAHRRFLSDFYSGQFPTSFAQGLVFQENKRTGDRRISGTAASLAGLTQARHNNDDLAQQLAIERMVMAHAVVLSWGGIPLLYMGDELALENDYGFTDNPEHQADNRWVHRPAMDWARASRAQTEATSVEGRVYHRLLRLITARKTTPHLHASIKSKVVWCENRHIFAFVREHPLGNFLGIFNFSESPQAIGLNTLHQHQIRRPFDLIGQRGVVIEHGAVWLPTFGRLWLVEDNSL